MTEAHYSVVKYVPDPARNEALNLGILAWTGSVFRLDIDDQAVARVVRENPHLERDALLYLEPLLLEQLSPAESLTIKIHKLISQQKGFPVVFGEPRLTQVGDGGIEATMERLLDRIVRPKRRTGGGAANPAELLAKHLRPLLQSGIVQRHHSVSKSISGVPRTVDFFANSTVNVAVDVVRLAVSQADEIRKRADAEAFKVWDVLGRNQHLTFMAFCSFSPHSALTETNQRARKVIEAAGANVITVVEEAAAALGADALI